MPNKKYTALKGFAAFGKSYKAGQKGISLPDDKANRLIAMKRIAPNGTDAADEAEVVAEVEAEEAEVEAEVEAEEAMPGVGKGKGKGKGK